MLLHNKRNSNLVIKNGNAVVTFAKNAVLDVEEETAKWLMKMYPGLVIKVNTAQEAPNNDEPLIEGDPEAAAKAANGNKDKKRK